MNNFEFWRRWITWHFYEIFWKLISIKTKIIKLGAYAYVSAVLAWLLDILIVQVTAGLPIKIQGATLRGKRHKQMLLSLVCLSEWNSEAIWFFFADNQSWYLSADISWEFYEIPCCVLNFFLYLFNIHDHNVKEKSCVGRNDFSSPPLTIGKVCRHYKMTLLFRANTKETLKQKLQKGYLRL